MWNQIVSIKEDKKLWLIRVTDISVATSAITSMQLPKPCSIIWKQRRMSTIAPIAQKFSHVSAIYDGTYRYMGLSVSMSLLVNSSQMLW